MLHVIALAVCATAVVTDVRGLRIPNELTAVGMIAGLAIDPSLAILPAALLAMLVFGIPAAFDKVGMGDVKLALAVAMLLRWPLVVPFLLYTALAGGVVAIVYGLLGRRKMPYALALAAGCAWAIAATHIPALRLL